MKRPALKRYPNLYLLGAPKAGSSFLHAQLACSPDIFASPYKEPAFFFYGGYKTAQAYDQQVPVLVEQYDENAYLGLFENWANQAYCIDASTHYLQGQGCAKRVHDAEPDAKLIAIMREPTARAYSQYLMNFRWGRVRESFPQAMLKEMHEINIATTPTATHYSFLRQSLYLKAFQDYFECFGADQFRVYKFEDVIGHLPDVLNDISAFLGVPLEPHALKGASKNAFKSERSPTMSNALSVYHKMPAKRFVNAIIPRAMRDVGRKAIDNLLYKDAKKPPLGDDARKMIMDYVGDDYPRALIFARDNDILFERCSNHG